ncbi:MULTISPECIES: hypothetical protein [Bacillus]|nr:MULTISPECIES: hypothetical protein [Bacillus]
MTEERDAKCWRMLKKLSKWDDELIATMMEIEEIVENEYCEEFKEETSE